MSIDFPPDLLRWIEVRLADGRFADASDYLNELIRMDRAGFGLEPCAETPEYVTWVREEIALGLASGVSDQDPFAFLEELRAKRRARDD